MHSQILKPPLLSFTSAFTQQDEGTTTCKTSPLLISLGFLPALTGLLPFVHAFTSLSKLRNAERLSQNRRWLSLSHLYLLCYHYYPKPELHLVPTDFCGNTGLSNMLTWNAFSNVHPKLRGLCSNTAVRTYLLWRQDMVPNVELADGAHKRFSWVESFSFLILLLTQYKCTTT